MPVDILVGTQWGDEGKGKLIDVLTRDVDVVVRFQGGNNAGHTVEIGDERYVLHLVPSGVFRPEVKCVIGNGVVADPVALQEELEGLEKRGIDTGNVFISNRTQLIFAYHRTMDRVNESGTGVKIGTTGRGIGPAYADKMRRTGIRAIDLTSPERLAAGFRAEAEKYNQIFKRCGAPELDVEAELAKVLAAAAKLAPRVRDTVYIVNAAVKAGKQVLFEGAQGALLDIDHGTYPFVTSSNTTSGGACTGGGVPPQSVRDVWGVIKAYTTRVGEGPFPTELFDACGENLRHRTNVTNGTSGVISQGVNEDSYSVRAISLVSHLLIVTLVLTHSVFDGTLDVVFRHVLALSVSNDSTQCRVHVGLRTTSLHGNGNLLANLSKRLGHVAPSLQFRSFAIFKCSSHWINFLIFYLFTSLLFYLYLNSALSCFFRF